MSRGLVMTGQRRMVIDWLNRHGGEVHANGTGKLDPNECAADAGWEGTNIQAWSSLMAACEKAGIVTREVNGKRTKRIALTEQYRVPLTIDLAAQEEPAEATTAPAAEPPAAPAPPSAEEMAEAARVLSFDYDKLARRLLSAAIEAARSPGASAELLDQMRGERDDARTRMHDATERARRAEQRRRELEDQLSANKDETVGLRRRLREAEGNLDTLRKRMGHDPEPASETQRRYIDKLMREPAAPGTHGAD